MKWIPFAVCSVLMAPVALGEGLVVKFDPPQKVEAVKAGEKDCEFFAATVGTVREKKFSKMASVQLKKGEPKVLCADECSPFVVLKLAKAVTAQSLVFTWKDGVVTGYLQDAKEVPKSDSFPQFVVPAKETPFFIKSKEPAR